MSTLWKMIVLEKKDDYIDLLVKLDHPDAGPFPQDKNFALQLLLHEAYDFDKNYERIPNGPLGRAISHEKHQPYDLEELVDIYIKDVLIYEAKNLPWDESEAHAQMDALCEKDGLDEDDDDWDDAWENHWRAFWDDYSRIPWAIYRITTTSSQWTEHLEKYQEFDSAGYSEGVDYIEENIKVDVPGPIDISDYILLKKPKTSQETLNDIEEIHTEDPVIKRFLGKLWKTISNSNN